MPSTQPAGAEPAVLAGLIDRKQLASQLGRSQRSIMVYESQGLPVIRRGRMRFYDVAAVRAWIEGKPASQPRRRRAA